MEIHSVPEKNTHCHLRDYVLGALSKRKSIFLSLFSYRYEIELGQDRCNHEFCEKFVLVNPRLFSPTPWIILYIISSPNKNSTTPTLPPNPLGRFGEIFQVSDSAVCTRARKFVAANKFPEVSTPRNDSYRPCVLQRPMRLSWTPGVLGAVIDALFY